MTPCRLLPLCPLPPPSTQPTDRELERRHLPEPLNQSLSLPPACSVRRAIETVDELTPHSLDLPSWRSSTVHRRSYFAHQQHRIIRLNGPRSSTYLCLSRHSSRSYLFRPVCVRLPFGWSIRSDPASTLYCSMMCLPMLVPLFALHTISHLSSYSFGAQPARVSSTFPFTRVGSMCFLSSHRLCAHVDPSSG